MLLFPRGIYYSKLGVSWRSISPPGIDHVTLVSIAQVTNGDFSMLRDLRTRPLVRSLHCYEPNYYASARRFASAKTEGTPVHRQH